MKIVHIVGCLVLCLVLAAGASGQAQKIGFFNSEAVMKQMPDAQDAQRQLDLLVAEWQNELSKMQAEWQKLYNEYEQRKLILTDQRRAEMEKELRDLDQRITQFRQQKFGAKGELFQKQDELMKPVQDRIFKAVADVAQEENYDYVFDKSGQILLMYTNDKYDLTQKVYAKILAAVPAMRQK